MSGKVRTAPTPNFKTADSVYGWDKDQTIRKLKVTDKFIVGKN